MEERIDLRFEAKLEAALRSQTRILFFGMLTAMATMTSLCLAAIAIVH
ncbi:MAG: hypothetical protein ACR2HY_03020 [Acidimicrobiales bacterium]